MTQITATVVTLNEEDNIRACLECLDWCDNIVVVDSYSDDRTIEIAREYTNQIYTFERTGFSEPARKRAHQEATGDWVFRIDADERVSSHLGKKFRELADQGDCDIIYAPRKNYIFGEWMDRGGWWPDYQPVLFRPEMATLSEEIHNYVEFSEEATPYTLPESQENAIVHFNYSGISDFIGRLNRYTSIEADQAEFAYRKLLLEPVREFGNRYIVKRGYERGLRGFFLSVFMAWYRFLTFAKAYQYETIGREEDIEEKYSNIE